MSPHSWFVDLPHLDAQNPEDPNPLGSAVFSTLTLLSIAAAFFVGFAFGRATTPQLPAEQPPRPGSLHDLEQLGNVEIRYTRADEAPKAGRSTSWSAYGL